MEALEGLKVLDLSRTLAGPFCTMLLGDMGADIIKVEKPGTGDETRRFTPPKWDGISAYYLASNRNKRSITIDMKSEEGKQLIYKMAKESDVFIENFRTGAMEKMGLGYEQLKKLNPRLIYCSISGFGRTGPEKNRAGYDLLLQGYGGLMSITGETGGSPVKTGMSLVDLTMGIFAAYGILTAVIARGKTGKGQFIDASLLDGQVSLLNFLVTSYFATGKPAGRMGSAHPTIVPYQAFSAKDMDIILAVPNDGLWAKCCQALNWEDLLTDPRFKTNEDRVTHRHELVYFISKRLSLLESKEIFACLDAAGVPCGPIHTIDQVVNHPHVLSREMILEVEHPIVKNLKMAGFPIKLSDTPASLKRHPPLLGEHTEEILSELGLFADDIEQLKQKHIVGEYKDFKSSI
ncbi:CaiB/BaiF CoA transferase family protein [Peribacillus castrilensis]|uniref:L-carnitine dehydratase/bile acid-inducible protein F n=1 Tax=Peribacillus simplex TaxID=1478 RepID=A0AAN2PJ46_9BACI|nr:MULTISPECIES: CaiB/BaiF CoA-transferase family protein [Bacillaceae]MCF7621976.1 CoA transferase [Peribacillus frigoritolerans]MCP1156139.1 CoA transferase [Peribacillus frigoritolerans]MCT1390727.1 CoA transferase [Peribacillus frigoritolerans]PRA86342.1 CoA transferase [Peribacillus simplex]CEG33261.1 L-carnitine dehydratase/bile acid-inducible protein F [Peribacillus simplex]